MKKQFIRPVVTMLREKGRRDMKKKYDSPSADVQEFDLKDVMMDVVSSGVNDEAMMYEEGEGQN